jgi:transposase-like protein
MCGEDSLSSTNCLRLDKPKLFSFFANQYTSAFKTKLVLELLQNESTLVQIASKHNILPQNLQNNRYKFFRQRK